MRSLILAVALIFATCFAPLTRAGAATTKPAGDNPVIAVFDLSTPLTETQPDEFLPIGPQPSSLRDLLRRMHEAAGDDNVKAVVILSDHVQAGPAQIEELRQAMSALRDKGKDVLVHADSMMMMDYALFSGASRLSVSPTGIIFIPGLHGEGIYLRGLLDKIGVQPDFIHMGAYKSASEIFMNKEPSKEADEMMNWLFDSLYASCTDLIASGRKVSKEKVKEWLDTGLYSAEKAKEAGIIDAVEHRQEFDAMLKSKYGDGLTYDRKYGKKDQQQLDFSSPFAVLKIWADILGGGHKQKPTSPAVGIVYVDGMILTGKSEASLFGSSGGAHSSDLRKALDEAARDDAIKAVVLRVDSPGGSAVASEIILDATKRLKEKKPLVVSMGDVAGSGGYYVAMGADTIFADPMTITASIGVVGGKLVTTDMWHKVGVNWHPYSRGKNADILASDHPFTDEQRTQVEAWMNDFYTTFKKHVTDSRGDKLKKPIDELAAGRVFTGKQALELGLVDKLGTMNDAIEFAAKEVKLEPGYDVRTVPPAKNLIEKLMEESNGSGDESERRFVGLGLPKGSLVDLAMPYLKDLDPARVSAVRAALEKLELLNGEQVLMVMPNGFVMN